MRIADSAKDIVILIRNAVYADPDMPWLYFGQIMGTVQHIGAHSKQIFQLLIRRIGHPCESPEGSTAGKSTFAVARDIDFAYRTVRNGCRRREDV